MLEEQIFNADAVTLNFAEGPPSGPPLVLLHGGGNRWQEFLPIIPSLAARWHIESIAAPGSAAQRCEACAWEGRNAEVTG
jgi:pimeloyl-ACP methyl ester carboxylesterase